MSDVLVLDYNGIRDNILNSDFMLKECEDRAKSLGSEAYDGDYHIISFKGNQRAHAIAFPNTETHGG